MKTKLLVLILLLPLFTIAQITQIGEDIDGEAALDESSKAAVSLSANGGIVAIGAYWNDGNGFNSGHVRVYQNTGGIWSQIGQDIDGEAESDNSGSSVCLSDDGSILAIGAPLNDGANAWSGHVRVYQNTGGTWTQLGQDIESENADDHCGSSVSLNGDGSIVAIGAERNDGNGSNSGHVRIFHYTGGSWTQIGQDIDGEYAGDWSGANNSVSLNTNGNIVAIGSKFNYGNGTEAGHVRIYQNIWGVWTQIGADIDGEAAGDQSGRSVSLNDDGSIVAIGASGNDGNGDGSGHVRVYQNTGGTWTQIGEDIDGEHSIEFSGHAVRLNDDGSIVAIGAPQNNGINGDKSGHVRIYKNTGGTWTQIREDIDGESADDRSGNSVSLSADGSIVAIGAFFNDGNGSNSGHVRVFDLDFGCSAGFSADPETLCQGDSVAFTDLSISTDSIISWQWSFEGGTPATSNIQNPVITYNNDGEYNVQLIVSNGILTDTLLQTNFIYVNLSPDPVISGPQLVNPGSEEQYQTVDNPGNTYYWEVEGGTITAGGATHQVTVMWGDSGEGSLTVTEGSTTGCSSITNPYLVIIDEAITIEENYLRNMLIYPNPAYSITTIETSIILQKNTTLSISNTSGQQLIIQQIRNSKTDIDISSLPSGIYIVKVWNDKSVMVQKVIKQ